MSNKDHETNDKPSKTSIWPFFFEGLKGLLSPIEFLKDPLGDESNPLCVLLYKDERAAPPPTLIPQ